MVVGNGLIASQFYDYRTNDDVIIFASGVSNSATEDNASYQREKDLLKYHIEKFPDHKIVYFSTCSIYDPSLEHSLYVQHKLEIEKLISTTLKRYNIFRLSNPIGRNNNPYTFFNFLANSIQNGTKFHVWENATRNIMDVDHMYALCNSVIMDQAFDNSIVNVAHPISFGIKTIVERMESHFLKKGNYDLVNKGTHLEIDISTISVFIKILQLDFGGDYIGNLLQKYFPIKDV